MTKNESEISAGSSAKQGEQFDFHCPSTGDCDVHGKTGEQINWKTNNSVPIDVIRKFSSSERTMKTCMDCGVLTIGAQIQFEVPSPMSFELVKQSFEEVESRCQTLQVNSVYSSKKKKHYWARMPSCLVRSMFDIGGINSNEVQKIFNEIVAKGIMENETIWRVYFMQIHHSPTSQSKPAASESSSDHLTNQKYRYGFFFIASHALFDGIGLTWVLNYVISTLCKRLKDSRNDGSQAQNGVTLSGMANQNNQDDNGVIKLCPPYEELVPNMAVYKFLTFPLCVTSTLILRMSSKMGKIPWSNHDLFQSPNLRPLMKEMQDTSGLTLSPGVHLMKFSVEEWNRFQEFRKEKGLTVTGLGLAIFGVALLKFAFKSLHWPRITLGAHILRDPRRYFKAEELDPRALIGNYIAAGLVVLLPMFRSHNKSVDKIVIEVAKLVTQQIRHNVRNFQTFFNGEVLNYIAKKPKLAKQLKNISSRDRRTCGRFFMIQFSNVGPVECAAESEVGDFDFIDVKKVIALADQSTCGDCFCNVLLTMQKQLFWTISYPTQLYSEETVSGLAQEVRSVWNSVMKPEAAPVSTYL